MTENETAIVLLTLGGVYLAGLAADLIGRRTRLPRVTLLLLLGVVVGPLGLDLLPATSRDWFSLIASLALVMVAFLLGGELRLGRLREMGRVMLVLSLGIAGITSLVVAGGLIVLGWSAALALLMGAIATSTDPAAVSDVVREVGAEGPLSRTLLGVVAIDDAWGVLAMAFALALVLGIESAGMLGTVVVEGFVGLAVAVMIGASVGLPMALLTGRIRDGEPTQAEALGGVLLCGGLALAFDVSFLLAAMTMGAVVGNLARHHRRPFRAIEGIEWPFMVLFFVLSGSLIDLDTIEKASGLAAAYVVLRVAGRLLGGWASGRLAGGGVAVRRSGLALLPQAGVAIGMALVASQRVPELGPSLLSATVAGTVFFELLGPLVTRREIERAGETRADPG